MLTQSCRLSSSLFTAFIIEPADMNPAQRRMQISELIASRGEVSVEALARSFRVSPETIRRDLTRLAAEGMVQKIHGGARRPRMRDEGSYSDRMARDVAAKITIAQKLATVISPGDTIFMDTGSTTLICAEALRATPGLTVITNSLRIANLLGKPEIKANVHVLGGVYSADNAETLGAHAIEHLGRFQADHAVLTVAALDAQAGAMDADVREAEIARAMIARADQAIVVAHRAKIGLRAAHRVCDLDEIDALVCDGRPDPDFVAALEAAGVDLI